jgi:hypothetical protein
VQLTTVPFSKDWTRYSYPVPFVLYSDDELASVLADAAGRNLSDLA